MTGNVGGEEWLAVGVVWLLSLARPQDLCRMSIYIIVNSTSLGLFKQWSNLSIYFDMSIYPEGIKYLTAHDNSNARFCG